MGRGDYPEAFLAFAAAAYYANFMHSPLNSRRERSYASSPLPIASLYVGPGGPPNCSVKCERFFVAMAGALVYFNPHIKTPSG